MPAPRRSDIRFDSRRPATTLVIVMMVARMVIMKMVMMMMMPKAMVMMIFLLGRCLLVFIVHLHPFLLLKTRPVRLHLRRSEIITAVIIDDIRNLERGNAVINLTCMI